MSEVKRYTYFLFHTRTHARTYTHAHTHTPRTHTTHTPHTHTHTHTHTHHTHTHTHTHRPTQEAKVFLLWEKAISLLLRQVRYGGLYLEVVPHLTALAACLTRFGEDKASDGILGVIGLGKKSNYSYK